jgi:hypothetical protein
MSFILQNDSFSCGAVAIINAYVYLNGKYPNNDDNDNDNEHDDNNYPNNSLTHLNNELNVYPCEGTNPKNFETHRFVGKQLNGTLKELICCKGFFVLYSFKSSNGQIGAHYAFVSVKNESNDQCVFTIYNSGGKKSYTFTSTERFLQWCVQKSDTKNIQHNKEICCNKYTSWITNVKFPMIWELNV